MGKFLLFVSVLFSSAYLFSDAAHSRISLSTFDLDGGETVVVLSGTFDYDDDMEEFVRLVIAEDVRVATFDSPGGNVSSAMTYGRAIRRLGLDTIQIRQKDCASACSLAFFGGVERYAESGSIGVHQASFDGGGMSPEEAAGAAQHATGIIMRYLGEMGISLEIMAHSLETDADDMRYLTSREMRLYSVLSGAVEETPRRDHSAGARDATGRDGDDVAIYDDVDLPGGDLDLVEVSTLDQCGRQCAAHSECYAFTYNAATLPGRGPNCFLKDGTGNLRYHSQAVSGIVLGAGSDGKIVTLDVLEPARDRSDVDIVGGDFGRLPAAGVSSLGACRIRCLESDECRAFSYDSERRECWPKATLQSSVARIGVISAAKERRTFSPSKVFFPR